MPNRPYTDVVEDFRRSLIIGDTLAIVLSELLVLTIRGYEVNFSSISGSLDFLILLLIPIVWLALLSTSFAWESEILQDSLKYYEKPLIAGLKAAIVISAFAYLVKEPISRITVISTLLLITLSVLSVRYILRHGYTGKLLAGKKIRILVLATAPEFATIKESSVLAKNKNVEFTHYKKKSTDLAANWQKLIHTADNDGYAGIIIRETLLPDPRALGDISQIQAKKPFDVFIYSDLAGLLPRFSNVDDTQMIKLSRPLLIGRHAFSKRFADILLSALALVALSPALLLIAALVKATSHGPIFYVDTRIGKNNELFTFPKFRSMYKDSDKLRSAIIGTPDASIPDRYKHDPRITPFGRFIRRWSIDELPQLWCVLVGTMSIVGPRPILREEAPDVGLNSQIRFIAKPGLTGLWQISGRKETMWESRMQQDAIYIESWSFLRDILIILRTFGVIISGKGAM
jgi:exopolysaccharide biosynthesis polyprenyl glycosylphosphotransferase